MKQIPTLLSICLLFSHLAYAAQPADTVETTVPKPSDIAEPYATADKSAPTQELSATPGAAGIKESPALPAGSIAIAKEAVSAGASEFTYLANYQLAPGDALNISVWKEDGLQEQQFMISPDGNIIFPLVGTVLAAGKTITELKDTLSNKLGDYISDPSVTVKLLNNQGNSVFVIGKVLKPGQYNAGRKIDVLQALSLAGGLTVYADEDSISIIRRTGNQTKVFAFDYSDAIKGQDLEQNILLEPGDTVTVP